MTSKKVTCCLCYEAGTRNKWLLARHLRTENGKTEYVGLIIGLNLCEECRKDYHRLAEKGVMPVTLYEDRDDRLSQYKLTVVKIVDNSEGGQQ